MAEITLKPATDADFQRAAQKQTAKAPAPATPEPTPSATAEPKTESQAPATVEAFSAEPPAKDLKQESAKQTTKDQTPAEPSTDPVEGKKPRKIKEISKPFFEKKAEPKEAKADIPEEIKGKLSEYEKKIAEYEARLNKETYKIVDEAEKAGKTIFDLFEEFRSEDITKLSPEEIYKRELLKAGTKPADQMDPDSEEPSLEEEMQKFRDMPKIARDREINAIKKQYAEDKNNSTNAFLSKLSAENQKRDAAAQAERERQDAMTAKAVQDYNALCDQYVGKEHYSVVGTPDMAKSLKNILQDPINGLIGTNQDGSLNIEALFDLAHYKLFKDLRMENLENQFYSQGHEDLAKIVEARGGEQKVVRSPQPSGNAAPSPLRPVDVGHPSVHV